MNAIIEVEGLRIWARHGVAPQERIVGNEFDVSVSLVYPPALKAVETDSVGDTLNYATLIDIIRQEMSVPSDLLEHIAGRIKDAILSKYADVASGRICIAKLAPPVSAQLTAARFILEF